MLKRGQRLDKYRIEKLLGQGGFASVFQAYDTIEGIRVALKIPHAYAMSEQVFRDFRKEVRLSAQLDHPNILPIKNASIIDQHLVIVYPMGDQTLAERLRKRLSVRKAVELAQQILEALAYAHHRRIIHCDVKPENFLLFGEHRLRLCDFGIAKVAWKTIDASGSGTVGYLAPEQAMGKPSLRSDVFSAGLLLYRMFSGELPEWPFEQPLPGMVRLRQRVHPEFIRFLLRALEVKPHKRYHDAVQMLEVFRRLRPQMLSHQTRRRRRRHRQPAKREWERIRWKEFKRQYGAVLETRSSCKKCGGPISEPMQFCPWCGKSRKQHEGDTVFPAHCRLCNRGVKLDWRFCPWCYSPGVEPAENRSYSDKRYVARCSNPDCPDGRLMAFMRYCPWCHRKVRRKWKIPRSRETCSRCGWGVVRDFWEYCPWCGKSQKKD